MTYWAEAGELDKASVEENHLGFAGTGYVHFDDKDGSVVFHNVYGGAGGLAIIMFRYALGGSDMSRGSDVFVNGDGGQDIASHNTGSWSAWTTSDEWVITPQPGAPNTVEIRTYGNDFANLDEIYIEWDIE